jgi:hypothetical protein
MKVTMISTSELNIILLKYGGMLSRYSALLHFLVITCLLVPTILFHTHILNELRIRTLPKTSIQVVHGSESSKRTLTYKK